MFSNAEYRARPQEAVLTVSLKINSQLNREPRMRTCRFQEEIKPSGRLERLRWFSIANLAFKIWKVRTSNSKVRNPFTSCQVKLMKSVELAIGEDGCVSVP